MVSMGGLRDFLIDEDTRALQCFPEVASNLLESCRLRPECNTPSFPLRPNFVLFWRAAGGMVGGRGWW